MPLHRVRIPSLPLQHSIPGFGRAKLEEIVWRGLLGNSSVTAGTRAALGYGSIIIALIQTIKWCFAVRVAGASSVGSGTRQASV